MNATMNRLMSELDRLIEIRDELASDIAHMGKVGRFGSIDCQDRVRAMETIGAQLRRVESALDACEAEDDREATADVTTSTTDNPDKNVQFDHIDNGLESRELCNTKSHDNDIDDDMMTLARTLPRGEHRLEDGRVVVVADDCACVYESWSEYETGGDPVDSFAWDD